MTNRLASASSLAAGAGLLILAVVVYAIGASTNSTSTGSLSGVSLSLIFGFAFAAALWLVGIGVLARRFGNGIASRSKGVFWAIVLLGSVPVTFVATVILLYSHAPIITVLVAAVVNLSLGAAGIVLATRAPTGVMP